MTIALFLQAIQALTGSQFVKDKLQRSEYVIRVLKAVGIDPEHPPEDFEAVYVYALVEYGYGKPDVCLEIFRAAEIRSGFRRSFDENDPQGWLTSGEAFLTSSEIGEKVRSSGCEASRELAEFAAAFLKVTRRSQTPKKTLVQHQLCKIERTIDRKLERVAGQLEAIANPAALSPAETLTLIAASCRAGELALRMRSWFEVLGYHLEPTEKWDLDYFEWVINIPKRRGFDRVLVRGIAGEAKVHDVMGLRESVGLQRVDEGWLVTERRISKAARSACETPENADLFCFTFDEFLDQDADFEGYLDWLEAEILARGIESRYVPLACMKEEFDPMTHQRLGMSRYGESDGWTEGYIDLWLDDPAKEHLSILGEFGTGKTWLTLHYASIAVSKYRSAKANGVERPRLPIVIPLRDYAKAVSVESLFSEFFFRKHEIPIPGYSAFVELNRMGKLLLIFDGFDEMAARVDKQQMINNFWELAKVVVPGSKVILTCRTEHFPDAKEGRSLLNAELQASTRGLSGETPQFEVLELEKFDDSQIREVLLLASSSETVAQVMGNPQLLDLARRPVMTELILEALPDIEAGKPVDMSRVYLYAVRRKMERDIRAERTFTSMADKLYFLCELSWEMLSNDRMSLNYREFPDRIRKLFGSAVQEEKDLDHWHYDMMGQTMLIRNSDGDYQPAHRSLLEFFVAFKFAAELGALAPDFLELAQMKSGIDRTLEPRDYTWSEYFGGGAVAPLKGFVTESLEVLRSGFGLAPLTKAVMELILPIVSTLPIFPHHIFSVLELTRGKSYDDIEYIGGNTVNILLELDCDILKDCQLSELVIVGADFCEANLWRTDFTNAYLEKSQFARLIGNVWSVAFSPDSKFIVLSDDSGLISLIEVETLREAWKSKEHQNSVYSVNFSPDGDMIASASSDSTIRLWEAQTGKCVRILQGHSNSVINAIFSPLGELIASTSFDCSIKLWNGKTGECLKTLNGHTDWVYSASFNQDGTILSSSSRDNTIRIWDVHTGSCLKVLHGHEGLVNSSPFSLQGQVLASAGFDKTIRLWDVETDESIKIFRGHTEPIWSLSFSPDSKILASGSSDCTVRLWDIDKGECINILEGHTSGLRCVAFNPKGDMLATAGSDQSVRLWSMPTGKCIKVLKGYSNQILSINPISSNSMISTYSNGTVLSWNLDNKNLATFRRWLKYSNAFAFNSTRNVFASADRDIEILSLKTQSVLMTLSGHTKTVYALAFNPRNTILASSSAGGIIKLWNFVSGECLETFQSEHTNRISSLAFSHDGTLLASGSYDKIIKVHNYLTGKLIRLFEGHTNSVSQVVFSHDDQMIASASYDRTIKLWDITTGECLFTLIGHDNWVNKVVFSPDGQTLASCSHDQTIKLWDMKSGFCLMTINGHFSRVYSLVFSLDGDLIISSDENGSIKIWSTKTGNCQRTLKLLPYEGMNITDAKGLTPGTIATLKALGAVENEE